MSLPERGFYNMARQNATVNRFAAAGQALVGAHKETEKNESVEAVSAPKKDKVITAKVYPETWAHFTAINKAQGMTNNSVINMLISEYVRNKKEILK